VSLPLAELEMDYAAELLLPPISVGEIEIPNQALQDPAGRILKGFFYTWSAQLFLLEPRHGSFESSRLIAVNAYLVEELRYASRDSSATLLLRPIGPGIARLNSALSG
jgi:hypothetical protein